MFLSSKIGNRIEPWIFENYTTTQSRKISHQLPLADAGTHFRIEETSILYLSFRKSQVCNTRFGTLIVATIYLQLKQKRYMFRSFTVLQCSHQHCVQPVASDVEVVGYL